MRSDPRQRRVDERNRGEEIEIQNSVTIFNRTPRNFPTAKRGLSFSSLIEAVVMLMMVLMLNFSTRRCCLMLVVDSFRALNRFQSRLWSRIFIRIFLWSMFGSIFASLMQDGRRLGSNFKSGWMFVVDRTRFPFVTRRPYSSFSFLTWPWCRLPQLPKGTCGGPKMTRAGLGVVELLLR